VTHTAAVSGARFFCVCARFSARSVSVQLNGADNADFRVGSFRFEVVERGAR